VPQKGHATPSAGTGRPHRVHYEPPTENPLRIGIARSLRADCLLLLPSGAALAQGVATLEVRDQEFLPSGLPTPDPVQAFAAIGSHINTD